MAVADEKLELMPRAVRDKLDRVGIKLHLREWQQLSLKDRQLLSTLPCEDDKQATTYAAFLKRIVEAATGHAPQPLVAKSS